MRLIDLTGKKIDRLTVIERVSNATCGEPRWRCVCDCGKEVIRYGYSLRNSKFHSCGCYSVEKSLPYVTKHGLRHHPLYKIWDGMKYRCYCTTSPNFKRYGGRGITICDEWLNDFQAFYDWAMSNGWEEGLSIERIDVNGNYEPSNCKWIPVNKQGCNTRANVKLTYLGETKNIADWSRDLNIPYTTIYSRLSNGWSVEKTLTTPVKHKKKKCIMK